MADNFQIKDAAAANQTVRTVDIGSNTHIPLAASDALPLTSATLTRPADVVPYASGDAMTNSTTVPVALTFANIANRNGGSFAIFTAHLVSSNQAGTGPFILDLYNGASAPTATNDNAAYNPSDADRNNCIGTIIFPAANVNAGSSNKVIIGATPPIIMSRCDASTTSIFGLLKAGAAYTPISAETFKIFLAGVRDN
jgi:hypothetical protein